jgi:protease YdgD
MCHCGLRRLLAAFFVSIFSLANSPNVMAENVPKTGVLSDENFAPRLDAICAQGQMLSKGCDAIRAREILDATAEPWRAIGRVNFASTQVRQHCTGTLVSERIVLTSGHCLYNSARKAWIPPQSIIFVAGFQRGSGVAVSRGERFILNNAEDTDSRDFRASFDQDWALIVLQKPIGRDVGYLNVVNLAAGIPEDAKLMLAGYPNLRPNVLSLAPDCGLPFSGYKNAFLLSCSAMQGDSGAPLLVLKDGKYSVAGVFSSIVTWENRYSSLSVPAALFADKLDALSEQTPAIK